MGILDILVLVIYVVGMLAVGVVAKGKVNSMDDFILGGKRFNVFALTGTILATMVGSGMLMGSAGSAYVSGAGSSVLWVYFGFGTGLILMGVFSKRLRKTGTRSIAEAISSAFGTKARLASAIVVTCYGAALVAINVAGLRTVIINVFGDSLHMSFELATLIAVLIPIAFTAMGGFFAVVWTDTIQLVIMIVGVFILGPVIGISAAGGLDVVNDAYVSEGMSLTNPFINGVSSGMIGLCLSYFLASPGDPTMPQRALSAKSDKTATTSFTISGVIGYGFGISLLLLGAAAHVLLPGLESSDAAVPLLIVNYYPTVIKGIAIAGIIAAIMSSFDSFLILATTHVMYDIGRVINPDLSEQKIQKALPILTIVFGIVGAIVALFISSLLNYLSAVFSIVGSALVPVMIAALYFREKTSKTAATLSIIVGAIVPTVLYFTVGYDVFLGDPVFLGVIASVAVLVIGSLILKDKPKAGVVEK